MLKEKRVERKEPENTNQKTNIISILFIIWFIASLIGMCVFAALESIYCIAILGQYFLVFGIAALASEEGLKKFNPPGIISAIVGIVIVTITCILIENSNLFVYELNWLNIIVTLFLLIFAIAGIYMIIVNIKKYKNLKENCTVLVYATIEKSDSNYNRSKNSVYNPVYRYKYEGETYETNRVSSNKITKEIKTPIVLKINPNKPEEFISESEKFTYILPLGLCFIVLVVPLLIYFIVK